MVSAGKDHSARRFVISRRALRRLVCCWVAVVPLLFLLVAAGSPAAFAKTTSAAAQRSAVAPLDCGPGGPPCPPPSDPTSGACAADSCQNLTLVLQTWTRWLSWILGGIGVLWVMAAFFRGTEPRFGHGPEGPFRRILMRVLEAALVFYIAVRMGDIATLFETIWTSHETDENVSLGVSVANPYNGNKQVAAGLVGPSHTAIAQLLGIVTALLIQVFLIYLAIRIIYQFFGTIEAVFGGRLGSIFIVQGGTGKIGFTALTSFLELIALGVGIVFIQPFLIWLFTFLTG